MKRTLSRRDFLKAASATLVMVVGGSVWRALEQGLFSAGPGPATEAWQNWRNAASPAERIVAAANQTL